MKDLPYHHLPDGTFRNPEGSPIRDPNFNWNGNRMDNNEPTPSGVYYYNCIANTIRLSGIVPVSIQGYLHLFRAMYYRIPA